MAKKTIPLSKSMDEKVKALTESAQHWGLQGEWGTSKKSVLDAEKAYNQDLHVLKQAIRRKEQEIRRLRAKVELPITNQQVRDYLNKQGLTHQC